MTGIGLMNDRLKPPAARPDRDVVYHSLPVTRYIAIGVLFAIALGGCGTTSKRGPSSESSGRGGYYLDDGPGANPPADIDRIPDPTPRVEPLNRGTMRPYVVMGKQYTPKTSLEPYRARGIASWYGRRYHGKQTASGETYDMYQMTAAHPVLPIPSYARVTNLRNGRSVIVRINDRGPFLDGREIDLSYAAAYKLRIIGSGSGEVEVESVVPGAEPPPVVAKAPERDDCCASTRADNAPSPASSEFTRDTPPVGAAAATGPVPDIPPTVSSAPDPVTSDASGIYLQLGAFGSRQNAESFLTRVQTQIAWLAPTVHIFPRDGLYRVHAGPYASRDEARSVADRISQAFGIKSFVLTR